MKRLHIVGCPRSGTTLMMELVSTCFENDGFCDHEMSLFSEPDGSPELYFSKQPSDIKFLGSVFDRDPGLYVIFMVRDPRSVISSIHRSQSEVYFCNFRVWMECYEPAKHYEGHPRFIKIRYEELTRSPDDVQSLLMNRFPFLVKKYPFSEYQNHARPSKDALNAMNGIRPVSSSRVAGWKNHLPRIKSQLLKHPEMKRVLVESHYETDDSWLNLLEGIEPADFPCRYPDTAPFLKRLDTRFRKWRQARSYLKRRGL